MISFKRESKKIMNAVESKLHAESSGFDVVRRMRLRDGDKHEGPTLETIHRNEQAAVEKLKMFVPDSELLEKIVRCIRWSWWERGFAEGYRRRD